jgi:hypothetical protein
MKHLRRYLEDQILARIQRRCTHPSTMVASDILEGMAPGITVRWCRRCGATQARITQGNHTARDLTMIRPDPNLWRGL